MEIIVMDADGSNPISLAKLEARGKSGWGGEHKITLCWSPDGSKIAFTKPDGDLIAHIYMINSDGTGFTQVTSAEGVGDINLSWSR